MHACMVVLKTLVVLLFYLISTISLQVATHIYVHLCRCVQIKLYKNCMFKFIFYHNFFINKWCYKWSIVQMDMMVSINYYHFSLQGKKYTVILNLYNNFCDEHSI